MTRAETVGMLRARVPVLTAFVALAVVTTMTVVSGVEREAPGSAPVAAPAEQQFEEDASGGTPMAGLIPWAAEAPWPRRVDEPADGLSQHPMLPQGRDDGWAMSIKPGDDRGAEPWRDHQTPSPDRSGSTDSTGPTEPGPTDPTDPGSTEPGPTEPGPSEPGPTEPGPTDPADPGSTEPGPMEPGPSEPGPTEPGPSEPGPTEPGSDAGNGEVGDTPKTEPATPVLVYDVGIGNISLTTDETGVSSLDVPITASSSSVLTGMVATVKLTLRSTAPADPALPDGARAPVTVRSAGGAQWSCAGPGGAAVGGGRDFSFPSGTSITCQRTYSSEASAPPLNLRVLARGGLQGLASVSAIGHVDPNQGNNSAPF